MNAAEAAVSRPTDVEFELIAALAYRACGLELTEAKRLMVWSRLAKTVGELNCRSFSEYYRHVVDDPTGEALQGMIDRLTTSFTSFMREPAHFEFLNHIVVPNMRAGGQARIWSAGAATGEEPYSIAISLLEGRVAPEAIAILATDISAKALATGSRGVYAAERLRGLDGPLLQKYFLKGTGGMEGWYRVKPALRRLVTFRRLNLVEPFPVGGAFSAIFCRNVMIYFRRETQASTVRRLAGCLEAGGYLMIGHSETLAGMEVGLEYERPAIYRKPEGKWKFGNRRK